jgi:hypothetical protein
MIATYFFSYFSILIKIFHKIHTLIHCVICIEKIKNLPLPIFIPSHHFFSNIHLLKNLSYIIL